MSKEIDLKDKVNKVLEIMSVDELLLMVNVIKHECPDDNDLTAKFDGSEGVCNKYGICKECWQFALEEEVK